jgi:hypothetical protein
MDRRVGKPGTQGVQSRRIRMGIRDRGFDFDLRSCARIMELP